MIFSFEFPTHVFINILQWKKFLILAATDTTFFWIPMKKSPFLSHNPNFIRQFAAFSMDHDVILWFIQINWTNIYEKFITRIYSVHHLGNNDKQMMTGGMGKEKRVISSEHLNIFDNMLSKHKLAFEINSTALTAIWYTWNLVVIVSSLQSAAPLLKHRYHSLSSRPWLPRLPSVQANNWTTYF